MKNNFKLNKEQIEYVIFHLKQHIDFDENIFFVFDKASCPNKKPFVFVPLSDADVRDDLHIDFMGKSIPIIFSDSDKKSIYNIDSQNNLLFEHDFFKSIFFVLSGYQEYNSNNLDEHNRFTYAGSIQEKLNFVHYPIVNYYFEMMIEGIEKFCTIHSFSFKRKKLFDNFGFFLSHDVDRIQFYSLRNTLYRIKQVIGLASLNYSFSLTAKFILKGFIKLLFPIFINDPWWNFDYLIDLERKLGINSTYYFLSRHNKKIDSQYCFDDKKIKQLVSTLQSHNFEVGLHGSYYSYLDNELMSNQIEGLSDISKERIVGNRQHFLRIKNPDTFMILQNLGIKYDNTLTFAEIDGYRNGYCYPFHPFDFNNNKMLDIWSMPLIMMEISVLNYSKGSIEVLSDKVNYHIEEAQKFGGLFSLLWHNCRLMDEEYPGIEQFYPTLLKSIIDKNPKSVNGSQIIKFL